MMIYHKEKLPSCFDEKKHPMCFYQNEDGSINNVSFGIEDNNPAAQSFRDGINPDFLVTIKYADGRPICDNCFPRLQQLGFWSQI